MVFRRFLRFIYADTTPGILLLASALLAIIVCNTQYESLYNHFLEITIPVRLFGVGLEKNVLHWINDGLMAFFFLFVGLEVKREVLIGNLNSVGKTLLPGISALGGVVLPAVIYLAFNHTNPAAIDGWAIPTPTDIAFALGVLALLGRRVPAALRVLLSTIAIFDDLLAIVIIATYYAQGIKLAFLAGMVGCFLLLMAMEFFGVKRLRWYFPIGFVLWVCVIKSGIHGTLAGVLLAASIPLKTDNPKEKAPLLRLESDLYPWVNFLVLPIFAFANAGVSLKGIALSDLAHPVPIGIALGLFLGKQLGVFCFSWLGIKLRVAELPKGIKWRHLYGMAILCGIGFTMSLFIATLAFDPLQSPYAITNRLGILLGSALSAVIGYGFLRATLTEQQPGGGPSLSHHH